MRVFLLVLLIAAIAMTAAAADVTGKWSGSFSLGDAGGSGTAFLVLKQTGATLSGTAGGTEDEQFPLENAKIDGNKISGTVNASDGNTYTVLLTVDGDKMSGELTVSGGGQTMKGKIELKRV